jgi:hypothetical protein
VHVTSRAQKKRERTPYDVYMYYMHRGLPCSTQKELEFTVFTRLSPKLLQ